MTLVRQRWTLADNKRLASMLSKQIDFPQIKWSNVAAGMGGKKTGRQCNAHYQQILYTSNIIGLSEMQQREKIIEVLMSQQENRHCVTWTPELRQQLVELYRKYKRQKYLWKNILIELKADTPISYNACREELLRLNELQKIDNYQMQREIIKIKNENEGNSETTERRRKQIHIDQDLEFITKLCVRISLSQQTEQNYLSNLKTSRQHQLKHIQNKYFFYDNNNVYKCNIIRILKQLKTRQCYEYWSYEQADQFIDTICNFNNVDQDTKNKIQNESKYQHLFNKIKEKVIVPKEILLNISGDIRAQCLKLYKSTYTKQLNDCQELKNRIILSILRQEENENVQEYKEKLVSDCSDIGNITFNQICDILKMTQKFIQNSSQSIYQASQPCKRAYIHKKKANCISEPKASPKSDQVSKSRAYSISEHAKFIQLLSTYGKQWKLIAQSLGTRSMQSCKDHYLIMIKKSKKEQLSLEDIIQHQ